MPIHTLPASWQVEQPLVTPVWICTAVGAGVAKAVPGAVLVALAATSPDGTDPRWQFSQLVPTGMCELAPIGLVGGCTTMLLMPKNDVAPMEGPWHAAQLLVMPAWLIWPLANVVAPIDAAPLAGISCVGMAFEWQLSQVFDVGKCAGVSPALVLGVTPMKVPTTTLGPWHWAQLLVMPEWLMRELLNFAPSTTGATAMLEPVPTWQDSQAAPVGMWLLGKPTIEKLAAGIAKLGAAAPWHWAQLLVVLGALAWMLASVGIAA